MRQHSIDLLPESARQRAQAGIRAGRFIAASAVSLGLLLVVATHSLFTLTGAQDALFAASVQAERVFSTEAKAAELRRMMKQTQEFVAIYERIATPIDISAVMATLINALPPGVTLDQFDLDAAVKQVAKTARGRGPEGKEAVAPPRVLTGEVSGFAPSDQQIAELVNRLEAIRPFRHVSLDFSRTRRVNGKDARDFRLSFKIDLDAAYDVAYRELGATAQEFGDVE